MKINLIRKSDGQVITKEVKGVGKNTFGNIQLTLENGKRLTLQSSLFEVKTA
jgi:predicted transport protein